MVLALDRPFVHRVRPVTGKDENPLNEVELLVDSLMNNDGIFEGNNVIKLTPDQSVLKLESGDPIRLTAPDFERLAGLLRGAGAQVPVSKADCLGRPTRRSVAIGGG